MKLIMKLLGLTFFLANPSWAAVDINTAKQSELESVKGLGPAKAKAIIQYREKNGPFKSVEELDKVKGFGKASVAKLKSELNVGSAVGMAGKKAAVKTTATAGK